MRTLFFSSLFVSLGVIFLLPSLSFASSQSFDLRIEILPADDGEEEPEATTTTEVPPSSVGGSSGPDSGIERAHDALVDTITDLIDRVVTPDSGVAPPSNDEEGASRDLSFVWSEDDTSAVRMLIVVPTGAVQNIDEVLITHLAFEPQQVKGVIDGDVYDISMFDRNGDKLGDFSEYPITITMRIPEYLQGRSALGLFYFDENEQVWTRVKGAVFSGQGVTFTTDHLSIFGIFALNANMAQAQQLVSEDGAMTDVSTRGVAGSSVAKSIRTVAEIIVFVLYACIVAVLVLIVRHSARFVVRKI